MPNTTKVSCRGTSILRPAFLLFLCCLDQGMAEEVGPTVKLPPFIVDGAGPSWRYGKFAGHEVLSRCNDATTKHLFSAFYRANQLFETMVPARFQITLDVPKALIFYDEELWPAMQQETVAAMLRLNPPARLENFNSGEISPAVLEPRGWPEGAGRKPKDKIKAPGFFGNMCLSDVDSITVFAIISRASIDGQNTYLTPEYVETLINRRTPVLPAWFRAGFLRLYGKLEVHDRTLKIRRPIGGIVTTSGSNSFSISSHSPDLSGKKILKLERQERASINIGPSYWGVPSFAPLGKVLVNGAAPIAKIFNEDVLNSGLSEPVWLAESELFVRWGIDPVDPKRVGAFWRFVERCISEPPNEEVFQACFGLNFEQATERLTTFLPKSDQLSWSVAKNAPNTFPLELQDASNGEISRIKGEWKRLETRYVRKNLPELEIPFLEQARKTLHRAYDRGDRDSRLLGTLGLLELDAGDSPAALGLFEAVEDKTLLRPRGNFELARLKYKRTEGRSVRNDGKISGEEASSIVEPLLIAAHQSPSIPQVYELIADVYVNCATAPEQATMDVLNEGIILYPRDGELVYRVAMLTAVNDPKDASRLIDLGLRYAISDEEKMRFDELGRKLQLNIKSDR